MRLHSKRRFGGGFYLFRNYCTLSGIGILCSLHQCLLKGRIRQLSDEQSLTQFCVLLISQEINDM